MGHAYRYFALPPSSRLYARLRSDKVFVTLMAALQGVGEGIFAWETVWLTERAALIDDLIARRRDILGPEAEARRRIDEFHAEVNRTRLVYPGVEHRKTDLEGVIVSAITEQVSRELARSGRVPGFESIFFLERLLFGDEPLTSAADWNALSLVPPDLVARGAEMLGDLDADDLFEDEVADDFADWQAFYVEAAERGDIILIGQS